ncbi:MAG: phage major capsid protein [Bacteroidales bacterium]|jgi:HK97 family phage major capsid protein|nr:phage major capsid protein [Bacteroidales bacterium]
MDTNEQAKKEVIETIDNQIKKSVEGFVSLDAFNAKMEEIKKMIPTEKNEEFESLTKSIDGMKELAKKLGQEVEELKTKGIKTEENELKVKLQEVFNGERFKSLAENRAESSGVVKLTLKETVSFTQNYSGDKIPNYNSNIVTTEIPLEKPYLRQIIPTIPTGGQEFTSFTFLQVTGIDRSTDAVSENGDLPEGNLTLTEVTENIKRIGWYIPVSRMLLRSIIVLTNLIMRLMPSGMRMRENFGLLYGDGIGNNIKGLTKVIPNESVLVSTIFTGAAGSIASIESYDSGLKTRVNLSNPLAIMETGMKAVFTGINAAMNIAEGFEIAKINDKSFVVDAAYTASETGSATITITSNFAGVIPSAHIGDAIRTAIAYLTYGQYVPSAILVHPTTLLQLRSIKDGVGRSIASEYITVNNGTVYFDNAIPVLPMDCVKKGKAIIGDFTNGCYIIDGQAMSVEVRDDVEYRKKNMVAFISDEELIFAVTNPFAFINMDIDTVIDAIDVANPIATNVTIVSPLEDGAVAVSQ